MADDWYYVRDGQRVGPISDGELKRLADAGTLSPVDMISKKGLGRWVPASSVKGLFASVGPQALAQLSAAEESTLFQEGPVAITNRRVIVGVNEFAAHEIRAVQEIIVFQHKQSGAWVALGFSLLFLVNSVGAFAAASRLSAERRGEGSDWIVIGLIFLAASAGLLVPARTLWGSGRKPTEYGVQITTPSGAATVLTSTDKQEVGRIISAIRSATASAKRKSDGDDPWSNLG